MTNERAFQGQRGKVDLDEQGEVLIDAVEDIDVLDHTLPELTSWPVVQERPVCRGTPVTMI